MNVYKQRLLNVARALRESPAPEKFYMADTIHDCGSPACAFGHYVCRTDLQSEFIPVKCCDGKHWAPAFAKDHGHCAYYGEEVREHFGLTLPEQAKLFFGGGCDGAKSAIEAAEFIERFVAKKWPSSERTDAELVSYWTARVRQQHLDEHSKSEELAW